MINIIEGDLLTCNDKYIAHICNCITNTSAGIAKSIFDKFPYSNSYISRKNPDSAGTIKILGNNEDNRYIINMFAQYYPGKSKYIDSEIDGIKAREKYFHQCLLKVAKINDLDSIGFNWRIGCGLAGGNWENYLGTLTNFAQYVTKNFNVKVNIYKRKDDE